MLNDGSFPEPSDQLPGTQVQAVKLDPHRIANAQRLAEDFSDALTSFERCAERMRRVYDHMNEGLDTYRYLAPADTAMAHAITRCQQTQPQLARYIEQLGTPNAKDALRTLENYGRSVPGFITLMEETLHALDRLNREFCKSDHEPPGRPEQQARNAWRLAALDMMDEVTVEVSALKASLLIARGEKPAATNQK